MANRDADALKQRDERFAQRLAKRERSVLFEIDQAYAPALRHLLCRFRGKWLNDEDIADILQLALLAVWTDYKQEGGASVRGFYFNVGRKRLLDGLKRASRREELYAKLSSAAAARASDESTPLALNEMIDVQKTLAQIMPLIHEAVLHLTSRQQTAFRRRFLSNADDGWAKKLESETGIAAQRWRKASDEARKKVAKFLKQKDVRYSEEGGHYEFARSRSYA